MLSVCLKFENETCGYGRLDPVGRGAGGRGGVERRLVLALVSQLSVNLCFCGTASLGNPVGSVDI